ncbi:MAG: hypothetical protein KatS3mg060_0840 [Dehalococcoidia bacterium]|nr:MAG: hypothetical protein KatS3mg060_0840 [Dehalococcoidia bacterium]
METSPDVLTRVLDRLAPAIAQAVVGRASRMLIWIAIDPVDDRCAIRFLTPASAILAEIAGEVPSGETSRLAGCYPALALPVLVTSPTGVRRSWLTLGHQPGPIAVN